MSPGAPGAPGTPPGPGGRRVLVTGLGTFWGARVAQQLERDPSVEVIVGLDRHDPTVELRRTRYVRSDQSYSSLNRIVRATGIDAIVHTILVVDSTTMSARTMHEINVIGTMNLFAAASAPGTRVRDVVVKSSTLVYGASARDPACFTEDSTRTTPAATTVEASLGEVESCVRDFAAENPAVNVALLRVCDVLGAAIVTPVSKALALPMVPTVFGFDPLVQFVHDHDVVRALLFALQQRLAGVYNVAADGMLPWSEVASVVGRRTVGLPPYGTRLVAAPLRRLGIDLPPELLALLRFGRGVDNRRFKQAGFAYHHTSAGTVEAFAGATRARPVVEGGLEAARRPDEAC